MQSRHLGALALVSVLGTAVLSPSAHAGVEPSDLCKDRKGTASGKYHLDLLKAFGRNAKRTNVGKLSTDISKGQSKLTKGFTRAEFSGSGVSKNCQTTGDVGTIRASVDANVAAILTQLSPPSTTTTTLVGVPCGFNGVCAGGCPTGLTCGVFGGMCSCHTTTTTIPTPTTTTTSTTTTSTTTTSTTLLGGVCPADGSDTGCRAFQDFNSFCFDCCALVGNCQGACAIASSRFCIDATDNAACDEAMNAAGCGPDCCP